MLLALKEQQNFRLQIQGFRAQSLLGYNPSVCNLSNYFSYQGWAEDISDDLTIFFRQKKNLTEEKKMKKINTLLIPLLHTKILLAPVQLKKWASKQSNFYDSDTSSRSTKKSLATVEVANHVCIAMTTKKLYYSTTKIGPKYTKITRQNHKELVAFISFQIFIQG